MMKNLYLFDVDGTITESGEKLKENMIQCINSLKNKQNNEIGIVGGGKLDKILWQTDGIQFDHYFTECGCVYHKLNKNENKNLIKVYEKNIRKHSLYLKINKLIKLTLKYLSNVNYTLTGNLIDLRSGIIYISLIGLNANEGEREYFKQLDKVYEYRKELLNILQNEALKLDIYNKIHIVYGGSVGIAIYPNEYDKKQVMNTINHTDYENIYYFGDKYNKDGNDFELLNHEYVIGYFINRVSDTFDIINKNHL